VRAVAGWAPASIAIATTASANERMQNRVIANLRWVGWIVYGSA
jgi:hypothetical protein